MFEGLILASHGYFGGEGFGGLFSAWEQAGVFAYVLPFLLIFAMVFGILTKVSIFGANKGINAILALTVGLLALQFSIVPYFFSEIFPRVGIGLSILLIVLIFMSMFLDNSETWQKYFFFGISAIIVIVIFAQTFAAVGFLDFWHFFNYFGPQTFYVVAFIIIIAIVVLSATPGGGKGPTGPPR